MATIKLRAVIACIVALTFAITICQGAKYDYANSENYKSTAMKIYHPLSDVKLRWNDAITHCRNHNWKLAKIESPGENEQLLKQLDEPQNRQLRFWTSGNDFSRDGNFAWYPSSRGFSYTNWLPGEPNSEIKEDTREQEHCVEVLHVGLDHKWNDDICSAKKPIVCEEDVSSQSEMQNDEGVPLQSLALQSRKDYRFSPTATTTWSEAVKYCKYYGLNVASIESKADEGDLVQRIREDQRLQNIIYWVYDSNFRRVSNNELAPCVEYVADIARDTSRSSLADCNKKNSIICA